MIFVASIARKDTNMAIAVLCTQLRTPNKDNLVNLVRVLRYVIDTLNLLIILKAYSLSVIKCWVDASFVAHPDCKGHNGAMISMESGSIMELSRKQKINGKSSTELDIVESDNAFPQCLLLIYLM